MGNAVSTKWRVDIAETALAFRRDVIGFSAYVHRLFADIPMPFRDNCRRWKPLDSAHFNVIDWCSAIWLIRFITGVIWTMGVLIGFMPLHNVKNTWKKRTLSARVLYQYGRWKSSALKVIGSSWLRQCVTLLKENSHRQAFALDGAPEAKFTGSPYEQARRLSRNLSLTPSGYKPIDDENRFA